MILFSPGPASAHLSVRGVRRLSPPWTDPMAWQTRAPPKTTHCVICLFSREVCERRGQWVRGRQSYRQNPIPGHLAVTAAWCGRMYTLKSRKEEGGARLDLDFVRGMRPPRRNCATASASTARTCAGLYSGPARPGPARRSRYR